MGSKSMNTLPFLFLMNLLLPATMPAQKLCKVVQPIRTTMQQHAGFPGKVVAEERLELRARITGYLGEIPVDHGTEVKRGDLLARLDVPDLDARLALAEAGLQEADAAVADANAALELDRAKIDEAKGGLAVCAADIALAKVQADRTRKLVAKQGATPQQLDEAEGRLAMARARGQMAEAAVVTAEAAARAAEASVKSVEARRTSRAAEVTETKAMLAFARIECPFERGVVTWRRLDPGALVRKDESVGRLSRMTEAATNSMKNPAMPKSIGMTLSCRRRERIRPTKYKANMKTKAPPHKIPVRRNSPISKNGKISSKRTNPLWLRHLYF
jgi:multidrug efflux pump subunit AcrA (membrane-fusion protein)